METNFTNVLQSTEKSMKIIKKFKGPIGRSLIKYCERNDISLNELYLILKNLMNDIEDSDPIIKLSNKMATDIIKDNTKDDIIEDNDIIRKLTSLFD